VSDDIAVRYCSVVQYCSITKLAPLFDEDEDASTRMAIALLDV